MDKNTNIEQNTNIGQNKNIEQNKNIVQNTTENKTNTNCFKECCIISELIGRVSLVPITCCCCCFCCCHPGIGFGIEAYFNEKTKCCICSYFYPFL